MSSEYSVFVRGDPDAVLRVVGELLAVPFRSAPPSSDAGVHHAELAGVYITFERDHGLENDVGIPFEDYPVSIEFQRTAAWPDPELREALCRILAQLCARQLARAGVGDTMVVGGVQELVETLSSHG